MPGSSAGARVLFSSSFIHITTGSHGGVRRAQQILALLRGADPAAAVPEPVRDGAVAGLQHANWPTAARYVRHVRASALRRARIAAGFARNYGDWRRALARYPEARVLVWEDSSNAPLLHAARDAGLRVIAVPQNLEMLAPGAREPRTGQTMPWSFEHEVDQLAAADVVYTISREEQWLLRLRGVAAQYLPFFPDQVCRDAWLAVRARRSAAREPFQGFVLLGSAVNPPTRAGIQELLTSFAGHDRPGGDALHVVGYGTEVFKPLESPGITVHGGLDDEALHALLAGARGVILHQPHAIGALTRIPEMLVAGLPILASPIAARSTSQYQGVVVYDSFAELQHLMGRPLSTPPMPDPPSTLEQAFRQQISAWIAGPERLATMPGLI